MAFSLPDLPGTSLEDLLPAVLDVSLAGVALLRPVYADDITTLLDFEYAYLNPAAQRLLELPARPAAPHAASPLGLRHPDAYFFLRDAFLTGHAKDLYLEYSTSTKPLRLQLAARRSGELLVLSVAEATSQEQSALATARRENQQLRSILAEAPAMICFFDGPQHTFQFVNPPYQRLVGNRPLVGKPIAEAMPELAGQSIFGLLDQVYQTGKTFYANEMLVQLDHHNEGREELEKRYYNFIYQARYTEQEEVNGIFVFAYDVTVQVLARQQVALQEERTNQLNEELHAMNEELHAANAEVNASNLALLTSQLELRHLNQELEARVADRTHALAQALAATERQRTLLYTLFRDAPAAICIYTGPQFVYEFVNPTYQRIFPGRSLLGHPLLAALPELAGTTALASLQHVYRTGETAVMQELPLHVARTAGGPPEECFFTFIYQARRTADGDVDGVLVFAHEVTDQVRARQLVEKSEQYLRRMADNVPTMIWLTNAEGQCLYLNQQWYDYTGQTEAEGLGMGWLAAVHPDDLAATSTIFLDASARQASFSLLYRLRRQDGRYRWAVDRGLPRFNHAGQFDGFVGTVFDIHEQKQAEHALQRLTNSLRTARDQAQLLNTELQASNEQLRRINADLDNFIYTASHDLKAPITNIEGLLYHLRDQLPAADPLTQQATPLLAMMQGAVERFQRTLAHLSDVTKLQKEQSQPVAQVALAAVVADVQLDLRPLLEESQAEITVELLDCPMVSFSLKNLRSVVYNLFSNALKYRAPGRPARVHLSCHLEDNYLVFNVKDNGLGLDKRQQTELFTMFRRFHTGVEGSGIGLYMVKKIMENAGGKLLVKSTAGVGSTFSAYFRR